MVGIVCPPRPKTSVDLGPLRGMLLAVCCCFLSSAALPSESSADDSPLILAGIFSWSFLLRKSGLSPCNLFFDNFGGLLVFSTNGHLAGFGGNEVGRSLPWISLEVSIIPVLLWRFIRRVAARILVG